MLCWLAWKSPTMELPWHQCFSYQRCRSMVKLWSGCSQQKHELNWNGGNVLYVCRWGGESVWRQCFHEETTVPHNHCSTQRPSSCFTGVYSCDLPAGSLPCSHPSSLTYSPTHWPIHQSIWFSQSRASVQLIHFTLFSPVSFRFHIHSHKTLGAANNHHPHHNAFLLPRTCMWGSRILRLIGPHLPGILSEQNCCCFLKHVGRLHADS